jgi:membrane fusion protein (multidrug efflux system)
VEEKGKTKDGKPSLFARQTFVTLGNSRGDQVAILKGIKEGERVITSGQLKLKSGSPVVINNTVQPLDDANPVPAQP